VAVLGCRYGRGVDGVARQAVEAQTETPVVTEKNALDFSQP